MCVILLDEEVFTSSTFSHTRMKYSLIQGSLGWGGGGVTPLFGPMELRAA